jgi:alanine-glyoxylate transaminase/serine-glyoxylate transaminase/serine-pyruvate transaminase
MPITPRLLLGPGPSNAHPRVLEALATPLVGHLDPQFLTLMDEVQERLRRLFGTQNALTLPLSATGSAGMEACLVNLLEPGDAVVIGVAGVFGERMCDVAGRAGARVTRVDAEWGSALSPHAMSSAIGHVRPKAVAFVHAETSTGVLQPVDAIARAAKSVGAMVILDCVTSLGGIPVSLDAWGVDAAYSGTQKCLSCPPGLSPISMSARAVGSVLARKTKVQSWYLDVTMLARYYGSERVYHHTAPISMNYALREALRLVAEEGLEARFARHRLNHEALAAGLGALGLGLAAEAGYRLPMLNAVTVPDGGIDEARVRGRLLTEYGIEIGGGLGPMKGRVWRIGLMGESSRRSSVLTLLAALEDVLRAEGRRVVPGAALAAAQSTYSR